jgi:hypothetical protein
MESLFALVLSLFVTFGGFFTEESQNAGPTVEYTCGAPNWIALPKVGSDNLLRASVGATCTFKGMTGGGLSELSPYLKTRVEKEAQTIHAGPTEVQYRGLPGSKYDVTVVLKSGDNKVTTRQDTVVASDLSSQLIFASASKSVIGEGMAKYLKKTDISTVVNATSTPGTWQMVIETTIHVEKPGIIPSKMFESEFKKRTEAEIPKIEKELIEDLAQHI